MTLDICGQPDWLFVIIEHDPFVAMDIRTTIAQAFPKSVMCHDTDTDAIRRAVDAHGAPTIFVADMPEKRLVECGLAPLLLGQARATVIIGDDEGTREDGSGWVRLAKPFSAEGLCAALTKACDEVRRGHAELQELDRAP